MRDLESDLREAFRTAVDSELPALNFDNVWRRVNQSTKRTRVSRWATPLFASISGACAAAILIVAIVAQHKWSASHFTTGSEGPVTTSSSLLNVYQPVIPDVLTKVDGQIAERVPSVLIRIGSSSQMCPVNSNGLFACKVKIPEFRSKGTTVAEMIVGNQIVLRKEISIEDVHTPKYIVTAVHAIINSHHVNIEQIRISQVKILHPDKWFVLYQIQQHGAWVPLDGNYGVTVTRQSSGQFTVQFIHY